MKLFDGTFQKKLRKFPKHYDKNRAKVEAMNDEKMSICQKNKINCLILEGDKINLIRSFSCTKIVLKYSILC